MRRQNRKDKPLGVCDVCHALTDQHGDVNHRCRRKRDGRRCSGVYKSGLGLVWEECPACAGRGVMRRQPCQDCGGYGWRLMR